MASIEAFFLTDPVVPPPVFRTGIGMSLEAWRRRRKKKQHDEELLLMLIEV